MPKLVLPEEFGRLASLEDCNLHMNSRLKPLPASFTALTSLRRCSLGGTPVGNAPEEGAALRAAMPWARFFAQS